MSSISEKGAHESDSFVSLPSSHPVLYHPSVLGFGSFSKASQNMSLGAGGFLTALWEGNEEWLWTGFNDQSCAGVL